jgi:hypothetical protein
MYPAIVDWTSGARAKFLASLSQVSQLAIRHCRRHATKAAFRGGKGKLAATKELNTSSGAAGSAANQQWRGQRAVAGLAAAPAAPFRAFQLLAPLRPPFAALPFLNSQALLAVGQELSLPAEGSLLTPVAAQQAPSFAAVPAFQAQLSAACEDGGHVAAPVRATADLVQTPREPRKAHSPLACYALLPASRTAIKAGGVSKQQQRHRQQSARQLMTALLDLAHLCTPEDKASNQPPAGSPGNKAAISQHALAPAAPAAANTSDSHGLLLRYARLSC